MSTNLIEINIALKSSSPFVVIYQPFFVRVMETSKNTELWCVYKESPTGVWLADCIVRGSINDRPTYDQAMALYHDVLPWSVYALRAVAKTAYDNPLEYENSCSRRQN